MKTRVIILAVALLVTAFFVIPSNISEEESVNKQQNLMPSTNDMSKLAIPKITIILPAINITPIPSQANESNDGNTPNQGEQDAIFGKITIETVKKTRTFDVMPDVDEETLRRNIGWLPSSALPGQEGLCVLLGHRDTDFCILENINLGDKLIITHNGVNYSYTVTDYRVVNTNNELLFSALNGINLILVTCYPFRYTGHAPKKFVVYLQ